MSGTYIGLLYRKGPLLFIIAYEKGHEKNVYVACT